MREILYRGKPKNKEHSYFFSEIWKKHYEKGFVYGSLIVYKDRCFIAVSAQCDIKHCVNNGLVSMIEVAPETVGQYTGLTDKNGKKIFDGDIIYCESRFDNANMVVIFECGQFRLVFSEKYRTYQTNMGFYDITCFDKEVIGNIHDNPEFLKGGADNG